MKKFTKFFIGGGILIISIIGIFFAWRYLEKSRSSDIIFAKGNSIWVVKENGTDLRKIYENSSWTLIRNISFSSDNKKIAIMADDKLFTMNSDFTDLQKIEIKDLNYGDVSTPIWFPDNNSILLVGTIGKSERDIYRYNFKTKELINLTSDNDGPDAYPQLSPDGKKILFTSFSGIPEISWNLYIMDADDGNKKLLINNKNGDCYDSSWSPSGNEIVVNCFPEGMEIFSYPDFKFKSCLTKSKSVPANGLQWAENGKIYFSWDRSVIHSINPNTKRESIIENPNDGDLSAWYVMISSNGWLSKNQNETADWKVYRSEQYKVEFKYPPDFIFDENCPGSLDNPAVIKSEFVGCDIGLKPHGIIFNFKEGPYASIHEAVDSIPVSVRGDIGPVESLTFNSNEFTRVHMIEYYGPGDIFYLIQYPKSNLFLIITVIPTTRINPETMKIIDYEQITRRILSTFKFIE